MPVDFDMLVGVPGSWYSAYRQSVPYMLGLIVPLPLCHPECQCEQPCPSIYNNLQHAIYLNFRTWIAGQNGSGGILVPLPFEFKRIRI
jgi:hypothetical protein